MTQTRNASDVALTLAVGALREGGATVSPIVNGHEVPTTGYAVGGAVPGVTLEVATLERHTLEDAVSRLLPLAADLGAYLGAWVSEGRLYLDVTEYLGDRNDAMALARERGELAVWDAGQGAELATV